MRSVEHGMRLGGTWKRGALFPGALQVLSTIVVYLLDSLQVPEVPWKNPSTAAVDLVVLVVPSYLKVK